VDLEIEQRWKQQYLYAEQLVPAVVRHALDQARYAIRISGGSMRFSVAILFFVSSLTLPVRGLVLAAEGIFSLKISPLQDTVSTGYDIK